MINIPYSDVQPDFGIGEDVKNVEVGPLGVRMYHSPEGEMFSVLSGGEIDRTLVEEYRERTRSGKLLYVENLLEEYVKRADSPVDGLRRRATAAGERTKTCYFYLGKAIHSGMEKLFDKRKPQVDPRP